MPWRHGTAFHVPFDWPMGCLVSDKHTILTKRLCKDNGKKSEKLLLNSFYSLFNKNRFTVFRLRMIYVKSLKTGVSSRFLVLFH